MKQGNQTQMDKDEQDQNKQQDWNDENKEKINKNEHQFFSIHFPFKAFFDINVNQLIGLNRIQQQIRENVLNEDKKDNEMDKDGEQEKDNQSSFILFPSSFSLEQNFIIANILYKCIQSLFLQTSELRPLELFSSQSDRIKFITNQLAKVIGMTCTHAGIARTELVKSGFSYTTLIMEEAAQAMEIETFIPLTMSAVKNNTNQIREKESEERRVINYRSTEGLRRIVLLGDHHQLPPVVQNPDLIRFSNFDQPLFTRMIRLIDNQQINENGDSKNKDNNASVVIWLDKQGRCRKSIADLFRYRYNNLGDLPIVGNQTEEQKEEDTDDMKEKQNHLLPQPYNISSSSQQTLLHLNPFTRANPGFQYEYQFIDVGGNQPIELNLSNQQQSLLPQPLFLLSQPLSLLPVPQQASSQSQQMQQQQQQPSNPQQQPQSLLSMPTNLNKQQLKKYQKYQQKQQNKLKIRETQPAPFFFQNKEEAKFVVETYKFMRLIGYPQEKITILAAYNGQKALLREMIEKECSFNPLYGRPSRLTTIDRYQGSQNDYVLVSLTRTARLGHLKDVRRLTVAVSRARLGLYVFGSGKLFLPQNLNEDKKIVEEEKQKDSEADTILPMMVRLTDNMNRPTRLVIGLNERYNSQSQTPTQRAVGQQLLSAKQISTADEMSNISRALEAAATAVAFGQR